MRTNILFNFYYLLFCITFITVSCEDETYDVVGGTDNIFYVRTFNPTDTYTYNILRTPVGGKGDEVLIKLPVYSAVVSNTDATVSAIINNELVEEYNSLNETSHNVFPDGVVEILNSTVHFQSGSNVSIDSLCFSVSTNNYEKFIEDSYLLPICLTNAINGTVSTTKNKFYVVVNSSYKAINEGAGTDQIEGNIIDDHSNWKITSEEEPDLNYLLCFDKDKETCVNFNSKSPIIVLDLGKEYSVSGLKLLPYGSAQEGMEWIYELEGVTVEISADGVEWTNLGSISNMIKDDGYSVVPFYGGISARYIRLGLTYGWGASWGSEYIRLHEIEVFATD